MKLTLIAPTEIPARRANTLQVMKMAQALVNLDHQVWLAAPSPAPGKTGKIGAVSWEELAHHYGLITPFPIEWLTYHPSLRRYDYAWKAVRRAQNQHADLVYTRLPQAAWLAAQRGLGTILEVHDLPQGRMGTWLFRHFLNSPGAKRLVVITQALADDLSYHFKVQLSEPFTLVAPDGVDLARYERLPQPPEARRQLAQARPDGALASLPPDQFTIGYTGHLYPGRGRELMLELAARLPEMAFLIVGGEPREVETLQAEIRQRGLNNLISAGFVPNAELPLYQAACEALLMPYQHKVEASSGGDISRYLSPMKLFEYLASERPIISSDLPVLQEVLNPQNAILVPTDDLQAWEGAIRRVQADPEGRRRLAQQARSDAEHYTWERRASRILENLQPAELQAGSSKS